MKHIMHLIILGRKFQMIASFTHSLEYLKGSNNPRDQLALAFVYGPDWLDPQKNMLSNMEL